MSCSIRSRLDRIASGQKPRVLDLFSGCGGISLGFERAGFEIAGGVEIDSHAARTHVMNFHPERLEVGKDYALDVTAPPSETLSKLGISDPQNEIDVLVGGPPCQAFARIGRAKLRAVAADPNAYLNDPRAGLYRSYLNYVEAVKPLAILMENVPDLMNFGGRNLADQICQDLKGHGYEPRYTLLNAACYGVPQIRLRCFIVALHKDLNASFSFPEPQRYVSLPSGYRQARSHALKGLIQQLNSADLFGTKCQQPVEEFFFPVVDPTEDLVPAVTVEDALSDLPAIDEHLGNKTLRKGRRPIEARVLCNSDERPTEYALRMREWPSRETDGTTDAHVTRILPRDYRIFQVMREGDEYPAAYRYAERIFEAHLESDQRSGIETPEEGTEAWFSERAKFVPPYDPGKFPNKWWKLRRDKPSRTLTAHIGKDTYSHIHYDSRQARTITVREAARLQSFPDGFSFAGSMNTAFRQIGNAVAPLLAEAIAIELQDSLTSSIDAQQSVSVAAG